MSKKKTMLIFDGHNTAFRCAAVMDLTNSFGDNISVPFGVLRSLKATIAEFKPDLVMVMWDGGRSTIRTELLPEYKQTASRKKNRSEWDRKEVYKSIETTQKLIELLGIPQIKLMGYEADDLIAKMSMFQQELYSVVIVSTDKDFYQLINDDVSIYNPIKSVLINERNFKAVTKFDLSPTEYLQYCILNGDKGDNISGVPGVGKKTAESIIQRYYTAKQAADYIIDNPSQFNKRERAIPDYRDIIQRNTELMDLKYFATFLTGFITLVNHMNVLNFKPKLKSKEFLRRITRPVLGFRSMSENFDLWIAPFRQLYIKNVSKRIKV